MAESRRIRFFERIKKSLIGWRINPECRLDLAALSVILLVFLLNFFPMILKGRFFVIADAYVESYPERVVAWQMIRQGMLPLWTPLMMSGYPLLSMAQVGIGYPLTWFYLFLPGHWAEEIYVLAPFLFSPAFTYLYAREIGRSRVASLIAALTFGYGGMMVISYIPNGMLQNSTMWTPLLLIAIERARRGAFIPCLLGGTAAYTMAILSGIGQGFMLSGLLASLYAAFVSLAAPFLSNVKRDGWKAWLNWERWRPVAVAGISIIAAAGISAFQILETMRAHRRSIRSHLTYETFSEGSLEFSAAWKSLLAPLYYYSDIVSAYVPLVALLLGGFGVLVAIRNQKQRDARIFFWLSIAVLSGILMLGVNTPVYRALYHVPLLSLFRGAARHAYEWTFAIGILAAYGWDAFLHRLAVLQTADDSKKKVRRIIPSLIVLAASLITGALWWKAYEKVPVDGPIIVTDAMKKAFFTWKAMFTVLILLTLWLASRIRETRWRTSLATLTILLACFIEPFMMISGWWWPVTRTTERLTSVSPPTRFLQQFPPEQTRVYTRVRLFAEELSTKPVLDPPNLTMIHGLHNVAGYEPLTLERYSRALGNVWLDIFTPRPGFTYDDSLFEPRSHVLNLLNTKYLLTYSKPFLESTERLIVKEGIKFIESDNATEAKTVIAPGATARLVPTARRSDLRVEGDMLAMVTTMANAAGITQGTVVAKLRIYDAGGRVIERDLRAGVDTAEWSLDSTEGRQNARHSPAPIFDSAPGDEEKSFMAHRYWTRLPLGERRSIKKVEISSMIEGGELVIWKTTLFDSVSTSSVPLVRPLYDFNKGKLVYNENNVLIMHNENALPRVWLVAEAEAVDAEEALRRIRGESEKKDFDPRRTALLEILPHELPALPGGMIAPGARAEIITYEPNRLVIETNAESASVLVVSEMSYPGWEATLDGAGTQIHTTDYLLRGVVLPPGRHRVEMEYKAPAARNGAFISAFTLLTLFALAAYERRRKRAHKAKRSMLD